MIDLTVAVDLDDCPSHLVAQVVTWATHCRVGMRLHLLNASVASPFLPPGTRHGRAVREALSGLLNTVPAYMRGKTILVRGVARDALLAASRPDSCVAVIADDRTGFDRLLHGSLAEHATRRARGSVLVMPRQRALMPARPPLRVVVPVDTQHTASPALERVRDWLGDGHTVSVVALFRPEVHAAAGSFAPVLRLPEPHVEMMHVSRMLRSVRIAVDRVSLKIAAPCIEPAILCAYAKRHRADLIVMSTAGGWESVTQGTIRISPCPVLVVRTDGP